MIEFSLEYSDTVVVVVVPCDSEPRFALCDLVCRSRTAVPEARNGLVVELIRNLIVGHGVNVAEGPFGAPEGDLSPPEGSA